MRIGVRVPPSELPARSREGSTLWSARANNFAPPPIPGAGWVDRVTGVPARPAAYVRGDGSSDMTRLRDMVIDLVQALGWPVPAVYADVGLPGRPDSQLAALVEAISAGRHDAVYATHPMVIGGDLDQIEAFDRLCRQHGVRLWFRWTGHARNLRGLFDVIRHVDRFTVTDEHV